MVKIACVHTGAGPGIFGIIEAELKKVMTAPYVVTHITDPDLISRISKKCEIQTQDVAELIRMYSACVDSGADIIVNMCSSIGDIADAAQPLFELAGTYLVRIDHRMCQEAVAHYRRIAVVATLASTMKPSCELVERCAEEQNKKSQIRQILVEGAFGLSQEQLTERILEKLTGELEEIDAVILAQNSMTESAEKIAEKTGRPVFASPAYAAKEVAEIAAKINV